MVKKHPWHDGRGLPLARILDAYPELSHGDVEAALEYATQVLDEETVIPRA